MIWVFAMASKGVRFLGVGVTGCELLENWTSISKEQDTPSNINLHTPLFLEPGTVEIGIEGILRNKRVCIRTDHQNK